MTISVMWFRRDLRLADNPALLEARANADEVVALFVLDDELLGTGGNPRVALLLDCLERLDESLCKR